MSQPDIDSVVESCWEKKNDEVLSLRLYYSLRADYERNVWKKKSEDEKNCPAINRKEIVSYLDMSGGAKKGEYWHEGHFKVKLTCYTGGYATVTNEHTGKVIKIKQFDCASDSSLVEQLFVEIDQELILVGSRKKWTGWCWYSVFVKEDMVEGVWVLRDYTPKTTAHWFKDGSAECDSIESGNIYTGTEKSLKDKKLKKLYILAVYDKGVLEVYNSRYHFTHHNRIETIYNLCYSTKPDEGKEVYALVVETADGKHLATIWDYDCAAVGLEKRYFAYTMADAGLPRYLAVGGKTPYFPWCQYGVCLDCETKRLLVTQLDDHTLLWDQSDSEECPTLKRENVLMNEDFESLRSQRVLSVHVVMEIDRMAGNAQFIMKEPLFIYCFYNEASKEHTMVIRTKEGRHLITVTYYDCSSPDLKKNTYVFTTNDNEKVVLGTRVTKNVKWCRFDVCVGCENKFVRKSVHVTTLGDHIIESKVFVWKAEMQIVDSLVKGKPPVKELESNGDMMKLVKKYKSGKFGLECFSGPRSLLTVLLNEDGKRIAVKEDINCLSIRELPEKLKTIRKYLGKEDESEVLIGFLTDKNTCCDFDDCVTCDGYKYRNIRLDNAQSANEWVKVPTESCYVLPKSNIFKHSSEVNLDGHKVIASYMTEGLVNEETFVLHCYKSNEAKGDEMYFALIKTLDGAHEILIKNLDCRRTNMLRMSYMAVVKQEGRRYLVLGTRSSSYDPWCRYDICVDCEEKDVRVNAEDSPSMVKVFKWSQAGSKLLPPPEEDNICLDDMSSHPMAARYSYKRSDIYMECYDMSSRRSGVVCSVVRRGDSVLAAAPSNVCLARYPQVHYFSIYTLLNDLRVTVTRIGVPGESDDVSVEKNNVKEQWLFYFTNRGLSNEWMKIDNPKLSSFEVKTFDDANEKNVCLPTIKEWKDFEIKPTFTKPEDEKKSSESKKKKN